MTVELPIDEPLAILRQRGWVSVLRENLDALLHRLSRDERARVVIDSEYAASDVRPLVELPLPPRVGHHADVRVVYLTDGLPSYFVHEAYCACGWVGPLRTIDRAAKKDAAAHGTEQ